MRDITREVKGKGGGKSEREGGASEVVTQRIYVGWKFFVGGERKKGDWGEDERIPLLSYLSPMHAHEHAWGSTDVCDNQKGRRWAWWRGEVKEEAEKFPFVWKKFHSVVRDRAREKDGERENWKGSGGEEKEFYDLKLTSSPKVGWKYHTQWKLLESNIQRIETPRGDDPII